MIAKPDTAALTGRKKPAQANNPGGEGEAALGHPSQSTTKPDVETQGSEELLKILSAKREAGFTGRGKYHHPTKPDLEALPEAPRGWIWASPEQLANTAPYALCIGPFGSNLKVSDYRESGTPLIFVRNIRAEDFNLVAKFIADEKANELAAHTAEGGDILITKMGEPPGDVALYPVEAPKAVITADCIKWRLAEDLRVPKFFVYAIRSRLVQQQIQTRTRGVAQKKISLERFRDLAIPLPPLPEQRRILNEIEKQFTRLEAGVAALRRVQANLKRYRAAVLKAACEGRLVPTEAAIARSKPSNKNRQPAYETGEALLARILTERRQNWQGRGRYNEPAAPDVAKLPPLPEGWTWSALAQLAAHITDGTHKTPTYLDSGVPFLSAKDISGFRLSFDKCRFISPSEHEELSRRCAVRRGNVLITKSGTIGRVAVVLTDDEFSLFESVANVPVLPPIEPNFLSIAAFVGIAGAFGAANQKGVAVRHLHLEDLRRVPIPLPPLAEQTRIVAEVERRLSVVVELEAVMSANFQRATRLRQSILQKAFTGEL